MRSVFALGLLVALCASADAATILRAKRPAAHLRPARHFTVPSGYTVPGWTGDETRQWLNNATAAVGLG
jgi:hypothetical protein